MNDKIEAVLMLFSVLLSRLISNVDDFNKESSMRTSLNRSATDKKICIVQIMEKMEYSKTEHEVLEKRTQPVIWLGEKYCTIFLFNSACP